MNKIIFLDIDNVLNVEYKDKDQYGHLFYKRFENNLNELIDKTNAKIVIISAWRLNGLPFLKELWKYRKLKGEIIDITPNLTDTTCGFYDEITRGDEIESWINDNKKLVDKYVIIDDINDFHYYQQTYYIKTSNNYNHSDHFNGFGLTKECINQAIKILND